MKPSVKQRLLAQIDKLIAEGQLVEASQFKNYAGNFVSMQDFAKWRTGFLNLVHQLGPAAKTWLEQFGDRHENFLIHFYALAGSLESLKEAIAGDYLTRIEDLIAADAFADLLEQADELLAKKYIIAAGVLGRAVLEEHLRKLCDRNSCTPPGRPTISDLNNALYKQGTLDKLSMQSVLTMAMAGNHCAHNNSPPLSEADVSKFLADVRDFLIRYPLS